MQDGRTTYTNAKSGMFFNSSHMRTQTTTKKKSRSLQTENNLQKPWYAESSEGTKDYGTDMFKPKPHILEVQK
jgi:hypothetical protein